MIAAPPFADPRVEAVFAGFPQPQRDRLLALRRLIFDVAAATAGVGRLDETLKWGQPAYLTPETKSGSTIRLGLPKTGGYALFVHCQTSILPDFRARFPDVLTCQGNRAVLFAADEPPPEAPLRLLIAAALSYHLR